MTSLSERYLARLGIDRPGTTDLAALETLLHAHLRAIPFETLSSFVGTPVSLVPADVYAKLLEGKRGGYCMEHALLSRTALAALGFVTEPALARVYVGPTDSAQTHAVTLVHLDGQIYMFDPGFGRFTPKHPLSLSVGNAVQEGRYGTYRLVPPAESDVPESKRGPDCQLVFEEKSPDGTWVGFYGLTRWPVASPDIEAFNWFVSTYPESVFVKGMMFARWMGDSGVGGMDAMMRKRTAGGEVEVIELNSLEAVRRALRDEMELGVDDAMVEKVWDNLVKKGKVAALSN
jgi:arylamine N-acetyltransferase